MGKQINHIVQQTPRLQQGEIWEIDLDAQQPQGDEINKYRRALCIGDNTAQEYLRKVVYVPITGLKDIQGREKALMLAVEIPKNIAGQTKDGLLMGHHPDTIDFSMIEKLYATLPQPRISREAKGSLVYDHKLYKSLLHVLYSVIFDFLPNSREAFKINGCSLMRGSIVQLCDKQRKLSYWVVVSSTLWLRLLSCSDLHSNGMRGLLRQLIHCLPIVQD